MMTSNFRADSGFHAASIGDVVYGTFSSSMGMRNQPSFCVFCHCGREPPWDSKGCVLNATVAFVHGP